MVIFMTLSSGGIEQGRRRYDAHSFIQHIVDQASLLFYVPSKALKVKDSPAFRKCLDDFASELPMAQGKDDSSCNDVESPEKKTSNSP